MASPEAFHDIKRIGQKERPARVVYSRTTLSPDLKSLQTQKGECSCICLFFGDRCLGLIAGWNRARFMKGSGYRFLRDIIIGNCSALVAALIALSTTVGLGVHYGMIATISRCHRRLHHPCDFSSASSPGNR